MGFLLQGFHEPGMKPSSGECGHSRFSIPVRGVDNRQGHGGECAFASGTVASGDFCRGLGFLPCRWLPVLIGKPEVANCAAASFPARTGQLQNNHIPICTTSEAVETLVQLHAGVRCGTGSKPSHSVTRLRKCVRSLSCRNGLLHSFNTVGNQFLLVKKKKALIILNLKWQVPVKVPYPVVCVSSAPGVFLCFLLVSLILQDFFEGLLLGRLFVPSVPGVSCVPSSGCPAASSKSSCTWVNGTLKSAISPTSFTCPAKAPFLVLSLSSGCLARLALAF